MAFYFDEKQSERSLYDPRYQRHPSMHCSRLRFAVLDLYIYHVHYAILRYAFVVQGHFIEI